MSVAKAQSDRKFEHDLSICSLNEKVYYSAWRREDPAKTLHDMLVIMTNVREELEAEDWKRHLEDEAYYHELDDAYEAREKKREEEEAKEALDRLDPLGWRSLRGSPLTSIQEEIEELKEAERYSREEMRERRAKERKSKK